MRAMILAAGLGERMGDLVKSMPKPLLKVNGRYLIEYAIANLKRAGITELVVNVHYHADRIQDVLGDGSRYGCDIQYSVETERLEVAGGIANALPLLGSEPFYVLSADVICDYPLIQLTNVLQAQDAAYFILVDNPPFHPRGDFGLKNQVISFDVESKLNYAGIGVYRPELFSHQKPGFSDWKSVLFPLIRQNKIRGEYYQGLWFNVGTPKELSDANDYFSKNNSTSVFFSNV